MEKWKEYKYTDLCTLIGGGTPKTSESSYWGGDIPWLSVKDFGNDGKYVYSTEKTITETGLNNSSTKLLKKDDIIISARGTIGAIAMLSSEMAFNQSCFGIRSNELVDQHYLYYLTKTKIAELQKNSHGSVFDTITRETFAKLDCQIPPIELQKVIASILSSLDDKIEVNRRINDNLEQQAQALFKSWLSLCKYEVTIGDLSMNITDYTKCDQKEVVLINSSDVTEGYFTHHNLSKNENLKGHFKKRFTKGDILYSQVRPRNRHWGYCTFDAENYLASTQLMVIRNKKDIVHSILLYQYLIDDNVWMDFTLKTETRSGTFPQGNYEDLSSIKVPFGADINDISMKLKSLYTLLFNNEEESRRLAQLRDTLLPRLMSGELKVNEIKA